MRLLSFDGEDKLTWEEFSENKTPPYAILSHTWETEEVSFLDLMNETGKNKAGYQKIVFCGEQAARDKLQYFWVDTCCIDKRNNTELTKAINSMFRWYRNATKCYVYLSDVSTPATGLNAEKYQSACETDLRQSRWFTRGWTLQELLAPAFVEFYSSQHHQIGNKRSLIRLLHDVTGIPIPALHGQRLDTFGVDERMIWAAKRKTTEPEDGAYCLLGIFNIFMPLIYGEGKDSALRRLQREVDGFPAIGVPSNIHQIQHEISKQEEEKILKWLVTTDPSPDHNKAIELHEPQTGTWLLRSDEYETWLNGTVQFFWVHGIPGAGKTVLLSSVYETVRGYCQEGRKSDLGYCYYYCYFERSQDETSHLLRWAISQLCRQSRKLPDEVVDLSRAGTVPRLESLISAFSSVVRSFTTVFLMVDALDETQNQARLASTLSRLTGPGFANVKIFATSRKESDIDHILSDKQQMSLPNPLVDEDIRLYIQQTLKSNHRFANWQKSLSQVVETALIDGARGMFRWVACQLDILQRQSTEAKIRRALKNLPWTLDETYERILVNIRDDDRDYAKRALQWLSEPIGGHFSPTVLAVAVTMPCQDEEYNQEEQLLDVAQLQEICTCLIDVGKEDKWKPRSPRLSHYSVKEFLYSNRIKDNQASEFFSCSKSSSIMSAKTLIGFLLNFDLSIFNPKGDWTRWPTSLVRKDSQDSNQGALSSLAPFCRYALGQWDAYAQRVDAHGGDQDINELMFKLLDGRRSEFEVFRRATNLAHKRSILPDWIIDDENWTSAVLAYLCKLELIEAAKEWLTKMEDLNATDYNLEPGPNSYGAWWPSSRRADCGWPLRQAAEHRNFGITKHFVLERRIDYRARMKDKGLCPLGVLIESKLDSNHMCELLRLMIRFGADVNPLNVSMTPLQVAIVDTFYREDSELIGVIKSLLECGADVNATGYRDGYSPLEVVNGSLKDLKKRWPRLGISEEGRKWLVDLFWRHGAASRKSFTGSNSSKNQLEMEID